MKNINFMPCPLQQRISKQINDGNPHSFAIADLGQGPLLTYRGCHVRLDLVSIDLTCGSQHIEISSHDPTQYIVFLAQNGSFRPVKLVLYVAPNEMPVLEYNAEEEEGLQGQVLGIAYSKDELSPILAHAIFQPQCSNVFALDAYRSSLLMEQNPELCNHCTLCAAIIGGLLHTKKGNGVNEV